MANNHRQSRRPPYLVAGTAEAIIEAVESGKSVSAELERSYWRAFDTVLADWQARSAWPK